jgi:hypothetical protein
MAAAILSYLWQTLSATLILFLVLLGPGLVLALILHFATMFVQGRAVSILGRGGYLGLFGWLGTIIHELGHAIFCVIFGHKITKLKLFHPDPASGTLGYVKHSYKRNNIYHLVGNFFIGIGPILLGTVVIFLFSYWLLNINVLNLGLSFSQPGYQLNSWETLKEVGLSFGQAFKQLLEGIFSPQHLASWQFYVYIYLVFAVGSSITLSPSDIKTALSGLGVIAGLIFVFNLATVWAGAFSLNIIAGSLSGYFFFYALIFLILLINIAAILLLLPLSLLKSRH